MKTLLLTLLIALLFIGCTNAPEPATTYKSQATSSELMADCVEDLSDIVAQTHTQESLGMDSYEYVDFVIDEASRLCSIQLG